MKKQRNTAQKRIIMQALERADHPTATELYEYVQAENPRISKATVFRVLSQYSENGEIRRLHLRGTDERYDATLAPHAHMRCAFCGKISDVMFPGLESVFGAEELGGYKIFSAEVDFVGCCPDCAAAGADEKNYKN
ncbi:MAG TPA: transcriptional repressor [Candidatus Coproplasma stercoravium]|nr:transcriptional repressor [Candidatus Coproplasma stercoravium]